MFRHDAPAMAHGSGVGGTPYILGQKSSKETETPTTNLHLLGLSYMLHTVLAPVVLSAPVDQRVEKDVHTPPSP